jgi:hypothetical protein
MRVTFRVFQVYRFNKFDAKLKKYSIVIIGLLHSVMVGGGFKV